MLISFKLRKYFSYNYKHIDLDLHTFTPTHSLKSNYICQKSPQTLVNLISLNNRLGLYNLNLVLML